MGILVPEGLRDDCLLCCLVGLHEIDREIARIKLPIHVPTLPTHVICTKHYYFNLVSAELEGGGDFLCSTHGVYVAVLDRGPTPPDAETEDMEK